MWNDRRVQRLITIFCVIAAIAAVGMIGWGVELGYPLIFGTDKTATLDMRLTVTAPPTLNIVSTGGRVTITPSADANAVVVHVVKHAPTARMLNGIDAQITQAGNTITVETTGFDPNGNGRGETRSVAYEITVPKQMTAVHVHTIVGKYPVTIEGIEGDLDVYTKAGAISISDYHGNVNAQTSFGTIDIINGYGHVEKHTGIP